MHLHALAKPPGILVCGVLAAAAVLAFVLLTSGGGSSAKASTPTLAAIYPALASTEPTGLPLISDPSSTSAAPTGPAFLASPPAGVDPEGWPIVSTIRKLPIDLPGTSAWIAQSIAGGICILDARSTPVRGHYPIGLSCSEAGKSDDGSTLETSLAGSGEVAILGVVPSSVSSVSVTLSDGSTKAVPVNDDSWGIEATAHLQSTSSVESKGSESSLLPLVG